MVGPDPKPRTILMVATVAATIRGFLGPYGTYLRQRGWRVEAAANGLIEQRVPDGSFDAIHELPLTRSIRDLGGIVRGERAVARLLREVRPDIVHVHTPIASFVIRWAARRMPREIRPAVVYTAHGFHFFRGGRQVQNAAFLTAERLAGRWTDRLIVINDQDEEAALSAKIVPASHVIRIPGVGLDTSYYSRDAVRRADVLAVRRGLGISESSPIITTIGELNDNKRQEDSILALARMDDRRTHLLLVGDGPNSARLREVAASLGVSRRVHLVGSLEDVRPTLVAAAALVSTSRREGLSRAIMEALALEVPVVASTARGNAELVADSGFINQTGDIDGIAAAMDWIVMHPAEASELGRRGRDRIRVRYDIQPILEAHERLYAGLIEARATEPTD
jgi:glycosyltransferase involved in cell wall biosynthesis